MSLLGGLALEAAKNIILGAMRAVTSADKAYHYLKGIGQVFTRAQVREAWKAVGEEDYWATVAETYGVERLLPSAWVVDYPTKTETGYMTVLSEEYESTITGERKTRIVSVRSSRRMSYAEAWTLVEETADLYDYLEDAIRIAWHPSGVFKLVPEM